MSKQEISLILDQLKEMHDDIKDLNKSFIGMTDRVSAVETKSKLWGSIGGTIMGGMVAGLIDLFWKR